MSDITETQVNAGATNLIMGFLKTEKLKNFEELRSTEERVNFAFTNEAYWPLLQGVKKSSRSHDVRKDKSTSKALRDAGNSAFSSGDDSTALDCYNQAVIFAPCDPRSGEGEDMAIALANRAAVLLRRQKYTYCLRDTKLAMNSGYPPHLRYKLLQRHAKCLCEMYRFREAKNIFQEAIDALEKSKLSKDQRNTVRKELQAALDAIQIKDGLEKALNHFIKDPDSVVPDEFRHPLPKFETNPQFPSLSEAVTIRYDELQGRHAVATRPIKAGEVVALEDTIVHFIYSERLLSNCTHCGKPVIIPYACYTCAAIVFCSIPCRDSAWNNYHRYECCAIDGIVSVYQSIFIAYRIICQKSLDFFVQNKALFETHDTIRGATKIGGEAASSFEYTSDSDASTESESDLPPEIPEEHRLDEPYLSSDYRNLFNLVTHSSDPNDPDVLALSASTALMLYYLKEAGYFGAYASSPGEELTETELYIGRLLYHFLEVSQFNTHQIAQMEMWDNLQGVTIKPLGSGIFPTLALLNHSCTPNTTRCNVGKKTLMVATKNIMKGEEVSDAYSMLYQDTSKEKRQLFLHVHYRFECRCDACLDNWPLYKDITKSSARRGKGDKIGYMKKMYATILKLTEQDLQAGYLDRIYEMWSNFYGDLEQVLYHPHKCYLRIAQQLFDCLWLKYGNRVPKLDAPVYKDHKKAKKAEAEDIEAEAIQAAMERANKL